MAKSKTRLVADYLSQIDTDPDTGEVISSSDYTDSAISGLISSAPDALNTLDELAAAINDDAGYYTTITNALATKYESGDDVSLGSATFTGDVLLNEATPFLRLQENSAGAKRLDLSVNSSAQAKIEANQSASTMIFNVSSSEALRLNYNANGAVFNEGGVDRDFRVESDTKSHALFVNGSDGYVGINRDSPAYQLHVNGNFYATTMRSGQFAEYYLSYGSGGGVHFIGQLRPTNYTDGYAHIRLDSSIDHGQGMPGTLEVVVKQRSGNYYGYAWRTGSPQNNNDSRVKLVSTDGGATIDVYLEVDDYLTGAISVTYRSGGSWTSAQSAGSFLESDVIWNSDEHLNSVENDGYMQINPSARDFDFYVATDNNGSTLYVNGQNDYVATGGTGTVTTEGSLRVHAKGSNNLNILRSYDQGTGLILSCTNNGGKDALISAMRGGQNLRIESAGTTTLGVGGDIFIYGENGNNDAVNLRFGSDDSVGATTNDRAQIQYYASNNNTGNLYFYTKKDAGSLYQTQAMYGNGGVVINEDSAAHIDFRVESDGNTHALFVDASTDKVVFGASGAPLAGVNSPSFNVAIKDGIVLGTDPYTYGYIGPNGNTGSVLIRSNAYPANLGTQPTVTIEAGTSGGGLRKHAVFDSVAAVFNEDSSDIDFRVESDANSNMFKVDAGSNVVGVGSINTDAQFNVAESMQHGKLWSSKLYTVSVPYADFTAGGQKWVKVAEFDNPCYVDVIYYLGTNNGEERGKITFKGTYYGDRRSPLTWDRGTYNRLLDRVRMSQTAGGANHIMWFLIDTDSNDHASAMTLGFQIVNYMSNNAPTVHATLENPPTGALSNELRAEYNDVAYNEAVQPSTKFSAPIEIDATIRNATSPDYNFIIGQNDYDNDVNQLGGSGVGMLFRPATNSVQAIGAAIEAVCYSGDDDNTATRLLFKTTGNDANFHEGLRLDYDGTVVVNEQSDQGADFRVESDGHTHALFVDAGLNRVSIFTDYMTADGLTIGTSNGNCELDLSHTGTNGTRWRLNSTSVGDFYIQNKTDGYNPFVILANQNVGIRNTSPYQALGVGGAIEAGDGTGTNGSVVLRQRYNGATGDYIGNWGTEYSSGAPFMSYGLRQSDSETGWKATYDNFTGDKGVLRVGANTKILAAPSADNTALGGEVTVYEFFSSGKNGTVINEESRDVDFRVESNANSNAIFLDGGSNVLYFMGSTYGAANTSTGAYITNSGQFVVKSSGANYFNRTDANGSVIDFYRGTSAVGSIHVSTTGTTYNTTSDRRLKENIEAITDGTDKLMAMRPVTHTWIADKDAPAVHGFIAQEMQEIVPEAVSGDPEGEEMMSMDYGRITPVLVAALQDAHRKIAELESRLSAMEAK